MMLDDFIDGWLYFWGFGSERLMFILGFMTSFVVLGSFGALCIIIIKGIILIMRIA